MLLHVSFFPVNFWKHYTRQWHEKFGGYVLSSATSVTLAI